MNCKQNSGDRSSLCWCVEIVTYSHTYTQSTLRISNTSFTGLLQHFFRGTPKKNHVRHFVSSGGSLFSATFPVTLNPLMHRNRTPPTNETRARKTLRRLTTVFKSIMSIRFATNRLPVKISSNAGFRPGCVPSEHHHPLGHRDSVGILRHHFGCDLHSRGDRRRICSGHHDLRRAGAFAI